MAWGKQARKEPPSRDCGKGRGQACAPGAAALIQPVACLSPASWDPEPPSLSGPALSRGPGGGGPELGWRRPAGRDQEEMGGRDPGPESCVCCWPEAGGSEGRRFACSPLGLLGSKVPPPGPAPWCFRPPFREDPDLSEGSRLIPHWLQS